jgi:hypothetical protein
MTTKNLLEFAKQGRPGFHLRGDPYSPFPAAGLKPPKVKPKKAKGLTLGEINYPGLFWIHLHIKLSQFLQEPVIYCLDKPIPSLKAVHEDNQVSSPGESHPQALSEPDVNLLAHPAPIIQPPA